MPWAFSSLVLAGVWMTGVPAVADAAAPAAWCRFYEGTGRVRVQLPVQDVESAPIVLARAGDAIVVDGQPCGDATVLNSDTIQVRGDAQPPGTGHRFEVDLSGGPFAPGRTDEGDGSSEIEMRIDPGPSVPDVITIRGGTEGDAFTLRGDTLNLDGAPDQGPDVRFISIHDIVGEDEDTLVDGLLLLTGGGADLLDVRGPAAGPGFIDVRAGVGDDEVLSSFFGVFGGGGDDLMRNEGVAMLVGGPGNDRLISHVHAKTTSLHGGRGNDTLIGGAAHDNMFGAEGNDVLRGRSRRDFLYGGSGSDRLIAGPGRDRLLGEQGADTLLGGDGRDETFGGSGRDRCEVDPSDPPHRSCEVDVGRVARLGSAQGLWSRHYDGPGRSGRPGARRRPRGGRPAEGTGREALALWHATYNLAAGTAAAHGLVAAIVSTAVIVWAVAIVVRELRREHADRGAARPTGSPAHDQAGSR